MIFLNRLRRPQVVTLLFLMLLGACKQSEFFEKPQLSEISTKAPGDNTDSGIGTTPTTSENSDNNGGLGTTPTTGQVIVTPPVVDTPVVVIPPVVDTPVVVTPPVLDTPVVVTPPVVDTPVVVTPPVVDTPVVVTPPVVDTPVVVAPPAPSVSLVSRTENFIQNKNRNGDVDILWVVDDSGSMADNQTAIAQNFQAFIDQFITQDVDFKMAITTTDGTTSRNGKMVGDSHLLTQSAALRNKAAFLSNFSRWIKVGTHGSGTEQGLKCASSFFDRYGSTFIRKDAYLALIFISDEEDQSQKKVSEYLEKFQSLKTNKGMVKAYSIVTQKLPRKAEWESIGTRYNYIAQNTAGRTADITDNFANILQNLGGSIVNLMDQFALADTPYNNTLEVYVNNVKQEKGWMYDSTSKSVKFLADSIPSEGASVQIKYSVAANLLGSN